MAFGSSELWELGRDSLAQKTFLQEVLDLYTPVVRFNHRVLV